MKKNLLNLSLLAAVLMASGAAVSACSGGDDDDDDDGASGIVAQADGGAADFTTCQAVGSGGAPVSVIVEVGKQSLDTTAAPVPTPGAVVVLFNPATGTTSGASAVTDADGLATLDVPSNTRVAFRVTHPTDGTETFVDAYDYSHDTPATDNMSGTPDFELRIIPTAVRNAIAAILGPPVANLAGLTSFAGTVRDCSGEIITGATLAIGGTEPPRCSSSSALPCVSYSTDNGEDASEESGQVFVLGLPGSGNTTITVQGVLTEGGAAQTIGTISVRGVPDSIALGTIPPQNAP